MKNKLVLSIIALFSMFSLTMCTDIVPHEEQMYGTWEITSANKNGRSGKSDLLDSYKDMQIIFKAGNEMIVSIGDYKYNESWMLHDVEDSQPSHADNCGPMVTHSIMMSTDIPALKLLDGAGLQINSKKKMSMYSVDDADNHYTITLSQIFSNNPRGTNDDGSGSGN